MREMDKNRTDAILVDVVDDCVQVALENEGCVMYQRFAENEDVFAHVYTYMEPFVISQEGDGRADMKSLIKKIVEYMKSPAFTTYLMESMFRVAPRYQSCEKFTKTMFEKWRSQDKAPKPIASFVASVVERMSRLFLRRIVMSYIT